MNKSNFLRVIGDPHGAMAYYKYLAQDAPYSLAVGDMGHYLYPLEDVDPDRNKIIAGNHEIYDPEHEFYYKRFPHFLGDWGLHEVPGLPSIFYVRGAWSIDWKHRAAKMPPDWWEEEQLSLSELNEAIEGYTQLKPEIVVTHEAPLSVVHHLTDPDFVREFGYTQPVIKGKTNQALQAMLEIHQPKIWVCGHYHRRKEIQLERTRFVCLDMIRSGQKRLPNSYIDIYQDNIE